jgi:fumarate reductase subunit C
VRPPWVFSGVGDFQRKLFEAIAMSSSKTDRRTADSLWWRARRSYRAVQTTSVTKKFLRIALAAGLTALPVLSCADNSW